MLRGLNTYLTRKAAVFYLQGYLAVTQLCYFDLIRLRQLAVCFCFLKSQEDQLGLSLLTVEQVESEEFQKRILQSAVA